jgi:hypothetical protein
MPAPVIALAAIVPLVIKTVIGAKIIGFVASWTTSATSASLRNTFLDHVESVREGLQHAGIAPENSDDVDLLANIETLRSSAKHGWTELHQTKALWEVMKFISWAHSKATAVGVGKFTASHIGSAFEMAERAGLRFIDFILPEKKKGD